MTTLQGYRSGSRQYVSLSFARVTKPKPYRLSRSQLRHVDADSGENIVTQLADDGSYQRDPEKFHALVTLQLGALARELDFDADDFPDWAPSDNDLIGAHLILSSPELAHRVREDQNGADTSGTRADGNLAGVRAGSSQPGHAYFRAVRVMSAVCLERLKVESGSPRSRWIRNFSSEDIDPDTQAATADATRSGLESLGKLFFGDRFSEQVDPKRLMLRARFDAHTAVETELPPVADEDTLTLLLWTFYQLIESGSVSTGRVRFCAETPDRTSEVYDLNVVDDGGELTMDIDVHPWIGEAEMERVFDTLDALEDLWSPLAALQEEGFQASAGGTDEKSGLTMTGNGLEGQGTQRKKSGETAAAI